jgi:hypothetical protein
MEITSQGAVNRHITEYLTNVRGVKQYKCKTLQNPDYFYNGLIYAPVNAVSKLDTSTLSANRIFLRDKGIVSVGTKQSDDAYKLIGLRPDDNQSGSEAVEFSIQGIEINGKAQTINLRDRIEVNSIITKFGDNLYIQGARQRTRVMVLADNLTESFKVTMQLSFVGCTVIYRDDLDEYWIYRGKKFFLRIGKPYLVDVDTFQPLQDENGFPYPQLVKHSLTKIGEGEYLYTKEPTEVFSKITLPKSFLIDADMVYSSTADGQITNDAATWAGSHDATSGTKDDSSGMAVSSSYLFMSFYTNTRAFFYYNVAGLAGTISSVDEYLYALGTCNRVICTQQGTQSDTLANDDFNNFTGNYFASLNPTINQYSIFSYNSSGKTAVGTVIGTGVYKSCVRNYTYDYGNSAPPDGLLLTYFAMAENTAGTKDPYLYVTIEAGGSPTYATQLFKHKFIPRIGGF